MNRADYSRLVVLGYRTRQGLDWLFRIRIAALSARVMVFAGIALRFFGLRKIGLKILLWGRRGSEVPLADKVIGKVIADGAAESSELRDQVQLERSPNFLSCHKRIIVLKCPDIQNGRVVERGVLLIKFSETFAPIFFGTDVHRLVEHFHVILEPSSAGYSDAGVLIWAQLPGDRVFVFTYSDADFHLLRRAAPQLTPIPLGPGHWVPKDVFRPLEGVAKRWDAICVANFSPKKRVDRYLRAVTKVSRSLPGFRAALVLASWGPDADKRAVLETIKWAQGQAQLDFLGGVSQSELNLLFNQSKVNVLASRSEGSNKGIAEGLFAGTPALVIREAIGGTRDYVNQYTGRVVYDRDLEKALAFFEANHNRFEPAKWARNHIAPELSARILSDQLKKFCEVSNEPWTRNIFAKVNRPELAYLDSANDWLLAIRQDLLRALSKGSDPRETVAFLARIGQRV